MAGLRMRLAVLVIAAAVAAAGCAQATPKDTVRTMVEAMRSGDKDAFVGCFKLAEGEKELCEATFDMGHAMFRLQKAITDAYGEDGWQKFQAAGGAPQAKGPAALSDEMLDNLKVEVTGDTATCTAPDMKQPMKMVKEDGRWKVTMAGMLPPAGQRDMMLKMMPPMKGAIEKVIAQAGKEGQTPETLNELMGQEMMKAMMGGAAGQEMMKQMGEAMIKGMTE